jgi:hypothetical protein
LAKLRTNLTRAKRLAEVDINIGDVVAPEKGEDGLSCFVSSCGGGPTGEKSNPDSNGAEPVCIGVFFVDLNVLESYDVDGRKETLETVNELYDMMGRYVLTNLVIVQKLNNSEAQVAAVPRLGDWMAKDRTQLLLTALGLGPAGRGPLLSGAVDQTGMGRKAGVVH